MSAASRIVRRLLAPGVAVLVLLAGCTDQPGELEVPVSTPEESDLLTENPEPPVDPEPLPTSTDRVEGEWVEADLRVSTPDDAAALTGLPEGFADYVADTVAGPDDTGCTSEIVVDAHHPAGYVSGRDVAGECGEATVVWASAGGAWGPVLEMVGVLPCSEFTNNAVPDGHPTLRCLDDEGTEVDW